MLIERYKTLLNRDIDDYSIGIKNLRVKKEMKEIEDTLNKMENNKEFEEIYNFGDKPIRI